MAKKKLYAHILLDRSGSMESCRDTAIGAFNEYVNSLRLNGDLAARISLTIFDDRSIDRPHGRGDGESEARQGRRRRFRHSHRRARKCQPRI
jgi:hypothetical protein